MWDFQSFDLPVLMNQPVRFKVFDSFASAFLDYVDTLKVSKRSYSKNDVVNFKQVTLVSTFVGEDYEAHKCYCCCDGTERTF